MNRNIAIVSRIVAFIALTRSALPAAAAEPATQPVGRTLAIKVTDVRTHAPLQGVTLKLEGSCAGPELKDTEKTDATGTAAIKLGGKDISYAYVTARKPGYVPMRLMWRREGGKNPEIPASYSLAMQLGTTISGRVLDESGKPVGGATVVFAIRNDKQKRSSVEAIDVSYVSAKADGDGKWSYAQAPAEFEKIDIGAWHHDCDITQGFFAMEDYEQPLSTLRDGSAVIKVTRGQKVEGTVFGSDGKPVAKATIGVGSDRVASNVIPAVKTDQQGHFSFGAKPGANVVVTARAPGHAPELQEFVMEDKPHHLDIHLSPAKTLQGRIVDDQGNPVQGVSIFTDTWRGHRTIGTTLHTDKDGHFVWKGAPSDEVFMDIFQIGYADDRHHGMSASSSQPIVVTLHKPLHVAGTVIDAATGDPVANFTLIHGITFDGGKRISWERQGAGTEPMKPKTPGKFEFEQSYPYPGCALRVEAGGYDPAESRVYTMDERNVNLTFRLVKGQPLSGMILMPDGKPAANANVQLATKDAQAELRNGRPTPYAHENITTDADAAGKFNLPPTKEDFLLVVVHDSGQAKLTKAQWKSANGQIKLEPWARVEGIVKVGAKAGANETVGLYSQEGYAEDAPRFFPQDELKADENGHFLFDRVFPGKTGIQRQIQLSANSSGAAVAKTFTAEAGKTAQINLGGTGRPVVGRVALPADMPANFVAMQTSIMTDIKLEEHPKPANFDEMSQQEKSQWYRKFLSSDAGKALLARNAKAEESRKYYNFRMGRDGSFRAEDVEPGHYRVNVQLAQPPVGSTCGWGDEIGSATAEFTVGEIPGGRSDEPLELPSIPFKTFKSVKVGDAAPDFTVKTLDGKDLKLSDSKGKYVLLDFWATWCGPCVAETPNLKAVYDTFGGDPRFVMISLSLDEKTDAPKKFVEKQGIKWKQGFLGEWSKASLPNEYGVRGIPSIWLIGPDGKVLAKDLRGADMKTKISLILPKSG